MIAPLRAVNLSMNSSALRNPWQHHLTHASGCGAYYDWLVHVGSLTERIRARCAAFRVRVVRQGRHVPFGDELAPLGIARGETAWVREVVLLCGDTPLVFAHTVLPARNARGDWRLLAGLGTKPLGELLFTDPLIVRAPLEHARLDARDPMHQRAAAACGVQPATLWGRRSLFSRHGRAILVAETFLPAILELK